MLWEHQVRGSSPRAPTRTFQGYAENVAHVARHGPTPADAEAIFEAEEDVLGLESLVAGSA